MVFPSNLHLERSVYDPVALLGAFLWGAVRKGTGQKARIFGATWFLLAYLPTSNLFDLNATVAEHWLYLPSIGFLIFLAGVLLDLPRCYLRPTFTLACLAVVGLSARSTISRGNISCSRIS